MVKIRIPLRQTYNYEPSAAQRRVWRVWGARFRRSATFTLLQSIEDDLNRREAFAKDEHASWLMRNRRRLRKIARDFDHRCNDGELDSVRLFMASCRPEMLPICVWLISKGSHRFRLYELKVFRNDPSPTLRRHVAKALRRLEAWSLLDEMAAADPDNARIQYYAKAPITHRPFRERLSRFSSRLDHSLVAEAAGPSRMPYWSLYTPWQGKPSKSVEFIREILWRIRRWVHGNK